MKDKSLFKISVEDPKGRSFQSGKAANEHLHKEVFREILKENDALMKRLSKR